LPGAEGHERGDKLRISLPADLAELKCQELELLSNASHDPQIIGDVPFDVVVEHLARPVDDLSHVTDQKELKQARRSRLAVGPRAPDQLQQRCCLAPAHQAKLINDKQLPPPETSHNCWVCFGRANERVDRFVVAWNSDAHRGVDCRCFWVAGVIRAHVGGRDPANAVEPVHAAGARDHAPADNRLAHPSRPSEDDVSSRVHGGEYGPTLLPVLRDAPRRHLVVDEHGPLHGVDDEAARRGRGLVPPLVQVCMELGGGGEMLAARPTSSASHEEAGEMHLVQPLEGRRPDCRPRVCRIFTRTRCVTWLKCR